MKKQPDLEKIAISHRRNFRIEIPYLLENLPQYNNYLKQSWHRDLENDNLLLRTMFGGIENSLATPPEIYDALNALEICLMDAGIFKRKYVYPEDIFVMPKKGGIHRQPIRTKRKLSSHKYSRIEEDGYLYGKSLYEIVEHLLTASQIKPICNRYKRDWKKIFQADKLGEKQKRFKRLNPYDPETLRERMDFIERNYPEAIEKFKEVLAEQFIPERIVVRGDRYGNPIEIRNPEGFVTPGKTYRSGVKGKAYWNLKEYANKIWDYFHYKEVRMQKRNMAILK